MEKKNLESTNGDKRPKPNKNEWFIIFTKKLII